MRKKEQIYLYVFVVLFIAYVATDFMAPTPVDWSVTFHPKDKNPFGGFILNDRSEDLFDDFEVSTGTISELAENQNLIILSERGEIVGSDKNKMFEILEKGGNVWMGANGYSGALKDTLGFEVNYSYQMLNQEILEAPMSTLTLFDSTSYTYPSTLVTNFFQLDDEDDWNILATIDGEPVAIQRTFNAGTLTLNTVPYIFTNFGLLVNDNYDAASTLLSTLPSGKVHFTLFYQSGKGEPTTPLRYFLGQDALRWSLFLALFSIMTFLIISSRRKQRAIPVVKPPTNATVHYVKTLGALFYREKDHKKAAMKMINHFLSTIREKYYVSVDYSERFYNLLGSKSGVSTEEVIRTFELIAQVKDRPAIEEKILIELTRKIELFK